MDTSTAILLGMFLVFGCVTVEQVCPAPVSHHQTKMVVDMVYKSPVLEHTMIRFKSIKGHNPMTIDMEKCTFPEHVMGVEFDVEAVVYDDYSVSFKPTENTMNRLISYCE